MEREYRRLLSIILYCFQEKNGEVHQRSGGRGCLRGGTGTNLVDAKIVGYGGLYV